MGVVDPTPGNADELQHALEYRGPAEQPQSITAREFFRLLRWSLYGSFFLALGLFCAYALLTNHVLGGTSGGARTFLYALAMI